MLKKAIAFLRAAREPLREAGRQIQIMGLDSKLTDAKAAEELARAECKRAIAELRRARRNVSQLQARRHWIEFGNIRPADNQVSRLTAGETPAFIRKGKVIALIPATIFQDGTVSDIGMNAEAA